MKFKLNINKTHALIALFIFLIVVIVDQLTKYLLTERFFDVIPNVLSIEFQTNTGAAWSILSEHTWLLTIISIVFLVILIIFNHFHDEKNKLYSIAYGLIVGGAVGNLADRIVLGHVRDFFKFEFINFPIFNVADIALTFGVILFCIYFLFVYPRLRKKTRL